MAITQDYQYLFGTLLMGSGTPYIVTEVDGLLNQPPVRQFHSPSQSGHGLFYGFESYDARTIHFDLAVDATSGADAESKLDAINSTFILPPAFQSLPATPQSIDSVDPVLQFQRPNKGIRQVYCHCTKSEFKSTGNLAAGLVQGSVELLCGDPRVYSATQYNLAGAIGGSTASVSFNVTNGGTFPSPRFFFNFSGPCVNPTLTNTLTGQAVKAVGTFVGTDTLQFDFYHRQIFLNGSLNYGLRSADTTWWSVLPGVNPLVYSRTGSDPVASPYTIQYLYAWATG